MSAHYDVIIIGGRCAGSSLAIHLARQNLKVLVVDRANFPSLPAVPSSPIIHAGTMRLMDELGIPEADYTHPDGKIEKYIMVVPNYFKAIMPTSLMGIDRNYTFGTDRNKFDLALWREAAKQSTVTARDCFSVTGILKDTHGKVTGIVGKGDGVTEEKFTADLVIGADGRFSFAAREFGAKIVEERNELTTASHHAEWENVADFSPEHLHAMNIYNTMTGFALIFIPINTKRYIIGTYMPVEKAQFGGHNIETAYLDAIKSIPEAWKRLENAQRVTEIVGVKKIQNGYRQAFGDGWALVGDALHYKDPIDGQGIYDALLEAKLLGEAIAAWKNDRLDWSAAGAMYHRRVMDETYEMFNQTVGRIKDEVYTNPPAFILKTLIRWTLTDPQYQAGFLRYICRAIDPKDRPKPNLGIILRGIGRDIAGLVRG